MKKDQEKTSNGEVAVIEKKDFDVSYVAQKPDEPYQVPVITDGANLPDLDDAEEIPLDLVSTYWTPLLKGEFKKVFFDSVKPRQVLDQQTGAIMELQCAFFYEKINGEVKTISNGSKRLVGIFEGGQIQRFTPLLITYLGKQKNANNSFLSDSWSVKILKINI